MAKIRLGRFLRTVRHLKVDQISYRLYYAIRNRWRQKVGYSLSRPPYKEPFRFDLKFPNLLDKSYRSDYQFDFLNQTKVFSSHINWNFMGYGQLWNYNLLYFDYILQPDLGLEEKKSLVHHFLDHFDDIRFAKDPYPISLRCVNWIKYLINNNIQDQRIGHSIYQQYYLLLDNIEYHLLGNHLFENGCSLLIGGFYFDDNILLDNARNILSTQLNEQILNDGGHFERSPMYHQLLLYRLLDCYHVMSARPGKEVKLREHIRSIIEQMLGWLNNVTFENGDIAHVNDATRNIAPTTAQLTAYAHKLKIDTSDISLSDSGYRMIRQTEYECFVDVGNIGPDYIPGHAHSDTFSFILHINENPIIVDTGISTYEECERRSKERSTTSHNTVMAGGEEQTEVWKSFRVGRRAHIKKMEESDNYIVAEHDGYQHLGLTHRRIFKWDEQAISITDIMEGREGVHSKAYLHFHPDVKIQKQVEKIIADEIVLSFTGHDYFQIHDYHYAQGYHRLKLALVVEITFRNKLETHITL